MAKETTVFEMNFRPVGSFFTTDLDGYIQLLDWLKASILENAANHPYVVLDINGYQSVVHGLDDMADYGPAGKEMMAALERFKADVARNIAKDKQ